MSTHGSKQRPFAITLLSLLGLLAGCAAGPPAGSASTTGAAASTTAGTAPVTAPSATVAPGQGRSRSAPNIIYVLTDDLSWNLVQYMPQVQQMQKDGLTFNQFIVTDSLCCP